MYIVPNGELYLLHNIPLDDTYNHTWYFSSKEAQEKHFKQSKYVLKYLTHINYQRYDTGVIIVNGAKDGGLDINEMYDCNYLMFRNYKRNGQPEKKWFYAFVTSIEYVSPNATKVYYKIDYMQTWITEFIPKQCFVEREHSATDEIGDNLVDENFGNLEAISHYAYPAFPEIIQWYIVIPLAPTTISNIKKALGDEKWNAVSQFFYPAGVYGGILCDLEYCAVPIGEGQVDDALSCLNAIQYTSVISQPYMLPNFAIPAIPTENIYKPNNYSIDVDVSIAPKSFGFNSEFTPKNKKLYTFPYSYIKASNNRGTGNIYKYELFQDYTDFVHFSCESNFTTGELRLVPNKYNNLIKDYDNCINISTQNLCPYRLDGTAEWFRNNALNSIIDVYTTPIQAPTLALPEKQALNIAGQTFDVAKNSLVSGIKALFAPDKIGSTKGGQLNMGAGISYNDKTGHWYINQSLMGVSTQTFCLYNMQIKAQDARIIDEFFTMFGYATNRVKVPNRNVREYHTYVKTNGCVAEGNVPADEMREICRQYDKGITFWNPKYEMGVYNHSDGNPTLK